MQKVQTGTQEQICPETPGAETPCEAVPGLTNAEALRVLRRHLGGEEIHPDRVYSAIAKVLRESAEGLPNAYSYPLLAFVENNFE